MPIRKSPPKISFFKKVQRILKESFSQDRHANIIIRQKNEVNSFFSRLRHIGSIAKNNYDLGKKHYDLGNFEDAVFRFKFVVWLEPDNHNAFFWMGLSYIKLNNKVKARDAFRKVLQLKPDWQEARELLKSISEKKVASSAAEDQ